MSTQINSRRPDRFEIYSILGILIYLLFFLSPLTSAYFLYESRFVGLALLAPIFGYLIFKYPNQKKARLGKVECFLLLLYITFFFLDLSRGFFLTAAGDALFIFIIAILCSFSPISIQAAFEKYNYFINKIAVLFIIIWVLATIYPPAMEGVDIPLIKSFGYYDFGGIAIPQLIFVADQASTLPVVIIGPILFSLFYDRNIWRFRYTLLATLLSLGGSLYFFVIIGVLAIPLVKFIPKSIAIWLPIILITLILGFTLHFLRELAGVSELLSIDEDSRTIMRQGLVLDITPGFGQIDYLITRLGSAIERAFTLVWQYELFAKSPVLGSDYLIDSSSIGSIIIKFGIRGGIIGVLLGLGFFVISIKIIVDFSRKNPNKVIYSSFAYSYLIQPIAYNENGFMAPFALITILLIVRAIRGEYIQLHKTNQNFYY